MFDLRYPAAVKQDAEGKGWVVRFPDLKGTNTGAASIDEALGEAADCLGSHLAKLLADRLRPRSRSTRPCGSNGYRTANLPGG